MPIEFRPEQNPDPLKKPYYYVFCYSCPYVNPENGDYGVAPQEVVDPFDKADKATAYSLAEKHEADKKGREHEIIVYESQHKEASDV